MTTKDLVEIARRVNYKPVIVKKNGRYYIVKPLGV